MMRMKLLPLFACLVLAWLLAAGRQACADDAICGSRCIDFVVRYFDQPSDLADVVHELQGDRVVEGLSFDKIQEALEARGIATRPVRLRSYEQLAWQFPAVVHIPSDRYGGSDLGHFVVLLPTDTADAVKVWDGLYGIQAVPAKTFYANISNVVLLVAPRADTNFDGAVVRNLGLLAPTPTELLACVVFSSVAFVLLRKWNAQGRVRFRRKIEQQGESMIRLDGLRRP